MRRPALAALLGALAAAAALPGALGVEDGSFDEDIFTVLSAAQPCVRRLNLAGVVGCATPTDGRHGAVYALESAEAVRAFADSPPSGDVAVFLPAGVLTRELADALRDSAAEMAGVAVGYGPVTGAHSPADPTVFNPAGDGMLEQQYPFAIVYLPNERETAIVAALAAENARWDADGKFVANRVDFKYGMFARGTDTSRECLLGSGGSGPRCDPMGGHSVWSSLAALDPAKGVVLATVGMDATSIFPELTPGLDAAASGLAATLAAWRALADHAGDVSALAHNVVFAAFQGESWDRVGSRRFFADAVTCRDLNETACDEAANRAGAITGLLPLTGDGGRLEAVLEVNQLYLDADGVAGDRTLYLHSESDELRDAVTAVAAATPTPVAVADATAATMPPAAFSSLDEEADPEGAVPRLLVAGFDAAYRNTFFHSHLDTKEQQDLQNRTTAAVSRVTAAATLLARAVFAQAAGAGGPAVPDALVASEDEVSRVLDALQGGEYHGVATGIVSLDSSVYKDRTASQVASSEPVPSFVSFYFSNATGEANNTHFHDALDPFVAVDDELRRYVIDDSLNASSEANVWTESGWGAVRTRVFRQEDPVVAWTMLGVGLGLSLATYMAMPAVMRWAGRHWKLV